MNSFIKECMEKKIDLAEFDIIAFDLFDTILFRTFYPTYTHHLWAEELIHRFSLNVNVKQLMHIRLQCSRLLKLKYLLSKQEKEYPYEALFKLIYKAVLKDIDYQEAMSANLSIEEDVEQSVCYINPQWNLMAKFLASQFEGEFICISDFYLPQESICKILYHFDLPIKFDKFYISTNHLATKHSGQLYKEVINDCGTNKILMIGDNYHSDFIMAKQCGLQSYHLNAEQQYKFYHNEYYRLSSQRDIAKVEFKKFINSLNIPFSKVIWVLYPFIEKLYYRLLREKCQHIFFLSREGQFYKKLFDLYCSIQHGPSRLNIETHYLYVSRKSTFLPSISEINQDSFNSILNKFPHIDVISFLQNLDLDKDDTIKKEFKDIYNNNKIYGFKCSKEFKRIITSDVFCQILRQKCKQQKKRFIDYLDSFQYDYVKNGLSIVDIGYTGTVQNHIYKVFNGKIQINGFYMFCTDKNITKSNKKVGILYDINDNKLKKFNSFLYNCTILEPILSANHGSVIGYEYSENKAIPILNTNTKEQGTYNNIVSPIQNMLLKNFKDLAEIIKQGQYVSKDYEKKAYSEYLKFVMNPSKEEMNIFLHMTFADNFASYHEFESKNGEDTRKQFFNSLKKVIKTKGEYLRKQNTFWVAAALYQSGLEVFNPYIFHFRTLSIKLYDYFERKKLKVRKYE